MLDGREHWLVVAGALFVLYLVGIFAMSIAANRWAMDPRAD